MQGMVCIRGEGSSTCTILRLLIKHVCFIKGREKTTFNIQNL